MRRRHDVALVYGGERARGVGGWHGAMGGAGEVDGGSSIYK